MDDASAYPVADMNDAPRSCGHVKWAALGLGVALCVPSMGVVQRYFGNWGIALYLLVGAAGLLLLVRNLDSVRRWVARCSDRQIFWLAGVTFFVILTVFLVVYPIANTGQRSGGSDSDDALNIAANELMHGRYPYSPRTYLDNPISPMPGAVLLAVPFVLLGSSVYQNLFWLFVFFIVMRAYCRRPRKMGAIRANSS